MRHARGHEHRVVCELLPRMVAAFVVCSAIGLPAAVAARVPAIETHIGAVQRAQATRSPPEGPLRGMHKGAFISGRDPAFTMRIAPELRYIGRIEFDLKETAHVERYHFVSTDGNRVTRMLVLQFAEMLPQTDEIYRWSVKKPMTIGVNVYQFSTFVFSVSKASEKEPEAEVARTQAMLRDKGLELDDQLAVARFARVIGEERRREFIIFYGEPLAAMSRQLEKAVSGEKDISPAFANLSDALTEHALASFSISDSAPH
jgi:hypothetical protein